MDRPGPDRVAAHLQQRYGIEVSGRSELDLGVYRVDRHDGSAWVARVFPPVRAESAVAGDAEILQYLQRNGYPAEAPATAAPLSVIDGHTVLVTEFISAVPRAERAATIRQHGGLRRLGELLGQLHTLPASARAAARPGGAWHHLADGHPANELRAIQALLAQCADAATTRQPHYATLARELAHADAGADLPEALIHPDFVLANVVASADRGMVLVDWTGAGRGPRIWPLAFLLYAEAAKNPPRAALVIAGYRQQVRLEPAEIERIPAMMWVRPAVLAAWSVCHGRQSAERAMQAVTQARQLADTVGPQIVAAFRARPA